MSYFLVLYHQLQLQLQLKALEIRAYAECEKHADYWGAHLLQI